MYALIAAAISLIVAVPLVLFAGRRGQFYPGEAPWNLADAAQRQVIIAGGLAGFAVTGMVLLVTLARDRADVETDIFNATVFMFLTAYLFFVSAAFLFGFLPRADADGTQPARLQFALAASLQFRSVMIAWFTLRPLMQTFGLDVLADYAAGAITFSLCLGAFFVVALLYGIGAINLREAVLLPLIAVVIWAGVVLAALTILPELYSPRSSLYLTAAIYGLNVLTFLHFSVALLAGMVDGVRRVFHRYSRSLCLADIQCTMVLLAFLWMAIMGIV